MPAFAALQSTDVSRKTKRGSDLPVCPVCADSMVAAEASAIDGNDVVSHLWTCDTCGYGLVTKHTSRRFACT